MTTTMTLAQRLNTWQQAADHHALSYLGLALTIAPFLIGKQLKVVRVRSIQTWLETKAGNIVRVTYKRAPAFAGRRIELRVNGGAPLYFGPRDREAIKALLGPL
jgi:hypothetical protein